MKTCFFIGHRDTPEEVRAALSAAVERSIPIFLRTDVGYPLVNDARVW